MYSRNGSAATLSLHPLVAQRRRLAEWIVTAMREHSDQGRYFGILRDQTQRFPGLAIDGQTESPSPDHKR
jgi:hypothetical protein